MHLLARYLDPRRSLASAIGWLVFAISTGLALAASVWVDKIVGAHLLNERGRQLARTAELVTADLNLNFALPVQSVRSLAMQLSTELREDNINGTRKILENLRQASPEFEWIGVANQQGWLRATTDGVLEGTSVANQAWFVLGLKRPGIRGAQLMPLTGKTPPAAAYHGPGSFVDITASVIDARGETVGVLGAQLDRRWVRELPRLLSRAPRVAANTETILLDHDNAIVFGPAGLAGKRWETDLESAGAAAHSAAEYAPTGIVNSHSRIERLSDGRHYLVAHGTSSDTNALHAFGWRVVVIQPMEQASKGARLLQIQITLILAGLGLLAVIVGVLLARRVTRDLNGIARSADAIRVGATQQITVPYGQNEAARLGRALDALLTSLQHDRSALQKLNDELDQRVAARTREIERLAAEERYAAVGRERLKIARDLHDTLAHSMMAMLTHIRLLKRLWATNPEAIAAELRHAEETAHQGLKDTRAAITQMRFNPVRDAGLSVALADLVKLFIERTGIAVVYTNNTPAGTFADERAETFFRIAEEALRNVERHARATRVTVSLRLTDDSRGLTLTIADNGIGFDSNTKHPGHYGLSGLHEQALVIGATLTIDSIPPRGTTICVSLALGPNL